MSGLFKLKERRRLLSFKRAGKFCCRFKWLSVGRIFAWLQGPVTDGDGFVEVLIDDDTAAIHRASPALFVDLQDQIVEFDGVVPINRPLGLDREYAIEIGVVAGNKSCFQCSADSTANRLLNCLI